MHLLSLSRLQNEASCLKFRLRMFQLLYFLAWSLGQLRARGPIYPFSMGALSIACAWGTSAFNINYLKIQY